MPSNPGFGALFLNKQKEGSGPDYTGNGTTPDGVAFDIAGWKKKDKNGETYLSLSIKPPYVKNEQQQDRQQNRRDRDDDNW